MRACDQSVSQVMATAAALIAAKKAKEKEAAMRTEQTEREQRRQLQQREMTPDNARIVEQKLLEFQKQQEVSHVSVTNGDCARLSCLTSLLNSLRGDLQVI